MASDPLAIRPSRDQADKRALNGAGVETPFSYRILTFLLPVPVKMVDPAGDTGAQTK
ncbi:hypothetical protein [Roseovarius sp. M141]|uniref:hypothetical protein n=1 Tax=Roseovarius sp. M141 TaxID=2583806 RepID=UPI0020CDFAB2|nr:hypothetical protein [Roseovarius sp. M141]